MEGKKVVEGYTSAWEVLPAALRNGRGLKQLPLNKSALIQHHITSVFRSSLVQFFFAFLGTTGPRLVQIFLHIYATATTTARNWLVLQSPVLGPEKDQGPNQTATDRNRTLVSVAMGCGWSRSRLPLTGLGERLWKTSCDQSFGRPVTRLWIGDNVVYMLD